MYVAKHIPVVRLVAHRWKVVVCIIVAVTAVTFANVKLLGPYVKLSPAVVSALGTAISFFIAFFTAQAYDRWWEARKIWGEFVNDSRSFGRMVSNWFRESDDAPEVATLRERIIRRHIAYLYAVKELLRQDDAKEFFAYLNERDVNCVGTSSHPGIALLELQGEDIDAAERADYIDVIRMAQLNDMLSRFSTSMGRAERIKLTVFPAYYASMVRASIWAFIFVFPATLSEQIGLWAIPFGALLGTIFYLVFQAAETLLDPFEGAPSDTPMSSIVRSIEIHLLEQIGEANIPSPVEPVDGRYLM